jgi:hypothetical protein
MTVALALCAVVIGTLVSCIGVRVLRLCVGLLGFGVGAAVAGVITWRLSHNNRDTLIAAGAVGVALAVALLCALKIGKVRACGCAVTGKVAGLSVAVSCLVGVASW